MLISSFQVFSIDVTRSNDPFGILLMTSPQFVFYSNPDSWLCVETASDDSDVTWTQTTFNDSDWPNAASQGNLLIMFFTTIIFSSFFANLLFTFWCQGLFTDDSTIWSAVRSSYDVIDIRAHWLWSSNSSADRVRCRVEIPESCSTYQG